MINVKSNCIIILIMLILIYGSSCHIMNDYETISLNSLRNHTNNILILKGKTNKTKCVALNPIYENETLFSFKENEIISSESSDFPEKDEIYRFLSEITSDQIIKNKIIVVLYILYEMNNSTNINSKKYFSNLPIDSYKHSFINWNEKDIDDYTLTGKIRDLPFEEGKLLRQIYHYLSGNFTLYLKTEKIFISLYYYVSLHSFVEKDENIVIVFPYIDLCNVYPNFLSNLNKEINPSNNTFKLVKEEDVYLLKSTQNFIPNQHFYFFYNDTDLSNNNILVKRGLVPKSNIYSILEIKFNISFTSQAEVEDFIKFLEKRKMNQSNLNYKNDKIKNNLSFIWEMKDPSINNNFFQLMLYHQEWYDKSHKIKSYFSKRFQKTVIRMQEFLFKQSQLIILKMKGIENYFKEIKINNDKKSEINNLIHLFNLENVKYLQRLQNSYYASSVGSLWRDINNYLLKYTNL